MSRSFEVPLDEKYPLPFVLAEGPRMMLNFLALHSNIPQRYREIISIWLHEHNAQLVEYIGGQYGGEAVYEADLIARAMAEHFLDTVRSARLEADREMFDGLEKEIFGDGVPD
ncbi:hypothetical protein SEA_NANOSMITE_67 [Mycobacterium phage Nanosmite]|nr:hypothetical protein SEA_NANOSMITE_67 [Mycobacterium phage Nanosmite]